jgi:hypothetical protein
MGAWLFASDIPMKNTLLKVFFKFGFFVSIQTLCIPKVFSALLSG